MVDGSKTRTGEEKEENDAISSQRLRRSRNRLVMYGETLNVRDNVDGGGACCSDQPGKGREVEKAMIASAVDIDDLLKRVRG
jgi:hypothetical protein